jgi:hypothetical protein
MTGQPSQMNHGDFSTADWLCIALWAEKSGKLTAWEFDVAVNLARQLRKHHPITEKQQPHAQKIAEKAFAGGWSPTASGSR